MRFWDWLLGLLALYTAVYRPFAQVFDAARWDGDRTLSVLIDAFFVLDLFVRLRTSFKERGFYTLWTRQEALHHRFNFCSRGTVRIKSP